MDFWRQLQGQGSNHMMRALGVVLGMSCLLLADDEIPQKVEATHTERVNFPSGGRLQLKNSIGELFVEGWDQPDVEITTIKSTRDAYLSRDRDKESRALDQVRISTAAQGSDLVITTEFPRRRNWLTFWRRQPADYFNLEYRIKVPMNARLEVDQVAGEVHVDNLTADIRAIDRDGLIALNLPPDGQYEIDAKSKLGDVISDFPGHKGRSHWFGHGFVQGTKAPHNLYLRIRFGDIIIYKNEKPPAL